MKKITLAGIALMCCASLGTPAVAQDYSPTATSEIYDFSGFGDSNLLDLFYNALQDGRKYPTQEEFEAAGIQASDIAFVRSHVRKAELIGFEDRLNSDISYANRSLWMNIPMGVGQDGKGGYPNSNFSSDVYSMWNYTNLFGSWNHAFFQAPGCWVDAAHKNGSDIFSGIKFFESWTEGSGDKAYSALISKKNADGTYKYVKPLINCLMFFGSDGINYNWEDGSYSDDDVVAFHKALYKEAEAQNFDNFHIGIYTSVQGLASHNTEALFGSTANGKTADLMLNYMGGDFTSSYMMNSSVAAAKQAMGTTDGLYTGVWIVNMNRSWTSLTQNPEINVCLWGEHAQSRFMSYNAGSDAFDFQNNYQKLLERGFSGGNRNPANRPEVSNQGNNWETDESGNAPLHKFSGLSEWIPERSAIQGSLPFGTHFILGNGDRYYYKGKKTAGSWYNMGAQDIVPTYRWLVYNAGTTTVSTDIQPTYTHKDAYVGGSSVELAGKAVAQGTDIILYKTKLSVNGAAKAKVAVKRLKAEKTPTNLYLILKVQDSDEWKEYPVGDTESANWEEKTLELTSLADGAMIERIGLRVKGEEDNYSLLVGKLMITDETVVVPSPVKDVTVEVKEETKGTMSTKIFWDVDALAKDRADWGLLYNDEANIDHFEILYKNGEKGRVSEISRTTSWSTFVGNIYFDSVDDEPYIGVRSVSTDLRTYSPVTWVKVPRAAQSELPDLVEEDSYGISAMDPACEGADIARQQRYVTSVVTEGAEQNLNYSANAPVADGSQYADCRDMVLKVKQGQTVTITIKAANFSDGLKWCFAGGWLDLDGSGNFNHPNAAVYDENFPNDEVDPLGERLFKVGKIRAASEEFQTTGITTTFTVPEDAKPGKSRLRIVFSDAWFAGMFLPTGLHAKGFSIDFGAEITGTNPGRGAADTRDQGVADEPEMLEGGTTAINQAVAEGVSKVTVEGANLNLQNVEKAWIYGVDGKFVKFVENNPASVNVAGYAAGTYIVKMQYKNVIRTQKVILK